MPSTMAPPDAPVQPQEEIPAISVLVVDGDGVSRRFIELALEKEGTFQVETAHDGAGALEILAHTKVHAVICETELVDMNGLNLFRRLSTESRLRNVPFLFLTSDSRVATRIVAFEAGIDDFMVKPLDNAELAARLRAHVNRKRRDLEAARRRGYMLAGRFSALAFPDLVGIVEQARRSGTLSIIGEDAVGAVYFDEGRVVHARFGTLMGQPAFQALMEETDAQFEMTQEPCPIPETEHSIRNSTTMLILESARLIDTRNNMGITPVKSVSMRPVRVERDAPRMVPAPALPPSVAARFIRGISDNFAVGDMHLYDKDDLARWTRSEGGRQRFHVHLVSDATEAVSAVLPLAGSPNERWVTNSLHPEPKALGLSFSFRHELLLDLVHLDVRHPKSFQPSLLRVPSALLIAPPGGDFLEIGTKAVVEIEQLIAQLRPAAILGVGNQALEPALWSLPGVRAAASGGVRLRTVHGVLGSDGCDLRSLLVAAIQLLAPGTQGGTP